VEAYSNLGNALLGLGELDLARQAYEKAVDLAPRSGRYYRALLMTKRVAPGDKHLAAMEQLAADMPSLHPVEQAELHFALGKAYADLGQHERSFAHLLDGNAIKRRELVYDETRALNSLYRVRDVFTPDLLNTRRNAGVPSEVPIFIVGMARSGTTLMEQILASHPKVFGAGERQDFPDLATGVQSPGDPRIFPEVVEALSNRELHRLGETYLNAIVPLAPEAARITDKMPGNFAFAGLIHLALPNARIIHMRRDPIDTCLSCFSILFTKGQPHTYDLAELGRYYRAYEALMAHWRRVLPAGVMLEIHYEDLVANLEGRTREALTFCGLDWDDNCLAFHTTRRSIRTASAGQARRPVYDTSIGRWRPYEAFLQPLIRELERDRLRLTQPQA
jgi:tetratricopeptide (TPR) repeat protein